MIFKRRYRPNQPCCGQIRTLILLSLDYRAYFPEFALRHDDGEKVVDAAVAQLRNLTGAFQVASRAALFVQTIAAPPERLFGNFDRRQSGTPSWLAARFNERLVKEILQPGVTLVDIEALASQVRLAARHYSAQDRRRVCRFRPTTCRFMPILSCT